MLPDENIHHSGRTVKVRTIHGKKTGWIYETEPGIDLFEDGVKVRKGGTMFVPDTRDRPTRGKITGWSPASRRRLRQLFLEASLAVPFERFSVTLTCPWSIEDWEDDFVGREWRSALKAFSISFERKFPGCVLIYRTELQQRKAPHIHGVIYAPRGFLVPSRASIPTSLAHELFYLELRRVWGSRGVMGRLPWTEAAAVKGAFDRRGVHFEPIKDTGAFLRYVADHASKRKQAQMGWQGRQWGVIGRKNLVRREARSLTVEEWKRFLYVRILRRLARYRIKAACNFGTKLSRKSRNVGIVYLNERQQGRIWEYIEGVEAARFEEVKEADRAERLVAAELMGQNVGLLK